MGKDLQTSANDTEAGVMVLLFDKVEFKAKSIKWDKRHPFCNKK